MRPPVLVAAFVLVNVLLVAAGCPEPPPVGRAADPTRAPGPAPWGSATSNAELERKVRLLDDLLAGKLRPAELPARVEKDYPEMNAEERKLALQGLRELLEDLKAAGKDVASLSPLDRDVARAQLYFSERRFIEAATILSRVLDQNPIYPGARNLLARCFFFLQNRDRTIEELEFVLRHPEQQKNREEVLDALFLLGAAVAETPGMSRENLEKGKAAWETYLQLAPDSPQKQHVERGLEEIEAGLRGEGRLAQPLVPKRAEASGAAPDNVMGGAASLGEAQPRPMGPGSDDGGAAERRADKLPPNATSFERALAEGLDALDARALDVAEEKLKAALAEQPKSPEALTGLGRVLVQSGRAPEALRVFGEAIKVAPSYMPAWHYNGMAHMMTGSPAEAVKSWEKIVEKDPAYARKYQLDRRIEVARRMK